MLMQALLEKSFKDFEKLGNTKRNSKLGVVGA